jgi:hypothetical protein
MNSSDEELSEHQPESPQVIVSCITTNPEFSRPETSLLPTTGPALCATGYTTP